MMALNTTNECEYNLLLYMHNYHRVPGLKFMDFVIVETTIKVLSMKFY